MTLAGLRPGEKLFEEKLMAEEGLKKTKNELIHIGCPIPFNTEQFLHQLTVLMKAAYDNDQNIREMVELIVPTYHPAGKNGSENKGKAFVSVFAIKTAYYFYVEVLFYYKEASKKLFI